MILYNSFSEIQSDRYAESASEYVLGMHLAKVRMYLGLALCVQEQQQLLRWKNARRGVLICESCILLWEDWEYGSRFSYAMMEWIIACLVPWAMLRPKIEEVLCDEEEEV